MNLKTLFPGGFRPSPLSRFENKLPADQLFIQQLHDYGLLVSRLDESGEIARVPMKEGKANNKNGWYVFFRGAEISSGAYGDWKTSESVTWCSHDAGELTATQLTEHREQVEKQKARSEAERAKQYDLVANEVQSLISDLPYSVNHPYLDRKQVEPYGLYADESDGSLIIPARNIEGEVRSIQRIYKNGSKYFIKGGQTKGCFHLIGSVFTEPTYITEGYATGATIHEVTGKSVVVAFNSGNLKNVVQVIRESENNHQLIICADNDQKTEGNPGVKAAISACDGQFGVSYVTPEFKGTDGTDFNDLFHEQGANEVINQILGKTRKKHSFELTSLSELSDPEPVPWLIEDFIVQDTLACVFGPSGSGKSFLILDMGLHIAAGKPWHNREVKQGAVVYICGEGRRGVVTRVRAWQKHYNQDSNIPFYLSKGPLLLLNDDSVAQLTDTIDEALENIDHDVSMIIVDTLNRNFGDGDENSTKDMTKFVNALTEIQHKTHANVCVVHHTGVGDASRARGSSVFRAALDTELSVNNERQEKGFDLTTTKQKDAEEHPTITFKHTLIQVNEETSSIVIEPENDPIITKELTKNLKKEGSNQRTYRKVIEQLVTDYKNNTDQKSTLIITKTDLNKLLIEAGIDIRSTPRIHQFGLAEDLAREVDSQHYEVVVST
jgi:putative DNA primase/helicase